MKWNIKNTAVMAVMVLAGLVTVVGSAGCDEYFVPGIGLVDPWYTSGYFGVPDATLYNPYNEIQGAIDYRLGAMENAANGWDEFIRQ